jgi:hypothetical protein
LATKDLGRGDGEDGLNGMKFRGGFCGWWSSGKKNVAMYDK